jgi:hypothetical protein
VDGSNPAVSSVDEVLRADAWARERTRRLLGLRPVPEAAVAEENVNR